MTTDLKYYAKSLYLSSPGKLWDYTGLYKITDDGEVYDSEGNRVKEHYNEKYPYLYVILKKDGKSRIRYIHRAVATSFPGVCGEINEVVNHLDENKLNNKSSNLHWCTNKENLSYGTIRERRLETRRKNKNKEEKKLKSFQRYQLFSI